MEDGTTEDETTATQDSHPPGTSLSAEHSVVTTLGTTLVQASQEKEGGDSTEQQPAQVTSGDSSAELETVVAEPMWPTPLVSTGSGDLAVTSGVAQSLQKTDTTSSVVVIE